MHKLTHLEIWSSELSELTTTSASCGIGGEMYGIKRSMHAEFVVVCRRADDCG
jgi:hypothetical protein